MAFGVDDAVMAAGVQAGGNFISGMATSGSSSHKSKREAKRQRAWQEKMANTQYQRAASDLEKAGLNRIIALGDPAPTPGGAMAQTPQADIDSGSDMVGAYYSAKQAKEQINLMKANVKKTEQDTETSKANERAADASASLANMQSMAIPYQIDNTLAQTELTSASGRKTRAEAAQAETMKYIYEAAQPAVRSAVDALLNLGNSAKANLPGLLERTKDKFESRRNSALDVFSKQYWINRALRD